MTTQALAEVRQTLLGWFRSEPSASVTRAPKRNETTLTRESADTVEPRQPVSEGTLNLLLLAMFNSASRMDSFGNFR